MPADQKDNILSLLLCFLNRFHKCGRVQGSTRGVEENFARAAVPGEQVEALGMNLTHFATGVASGSLDELRSDCVGVRITRFTNEVNEEFQACM